MSPYTSPFFSSTTGYSGETSLLDDLVREQIKLFGVDIVYMPRRHVNLDRLLHESSKNVFELGLPIPMYIKTTDGYDNGLEVLSKFGVRSSDEITLQMSRSEFVTHYTPFLKSYYNANAGRDNLSELDRLEGETAYRPKEGDLIYFPFDDGIFEIKYVMFDQPFFQLGRGYVFEIQCEKFEYSGENFSTGYDQIDDTTIEPDFYRMEFDLIKDTEHNTSTFIQKERVFLYNMVNCDYNHIDGGNAFYIDFLDKIDGLDVYATLPDTTDGGDSVTTDQLDMSYPAHLENRADGGGAPERPLYTFFVDGGDVLAVPNEEPVDGGHALNIYGQCDADIFRLYKDAGYIHRVDVVEGTVEYWNKEERVITLGDVSDLDPDQMSGETGTRPQEIDMNKFDNVMMVGQSSGAVWFTQKAGTHPKAFDDELVIQEEFNDIKIDDLADSNPFGFV